MSALTILWAIIGGMFLSCLFVVIAIFQSSGRESREENSAEIDMGALEGDLTIFVRQQNEVAR